MSMTQAFCFVYGADLTNETIDDGLRRLEDAMPLPSDRLAPSPIDHDAVTTRPALIADPRYRWYSVVADFGNPDVGTREEAELLSRAFRTRALIASVCESDYLYIQLSDAARGIYHQSARPTVIPEPGSITYTVGEDPLADQMLAELDDENREILLGTWLLGYDSSYVEGYDMGFPHFLLDDVSASDGERLREIWDSDAYDMAEDKLRDMLDVLRADPWAELPPDRTYVRQCAK